MQLPDQGGKQDGMQGSTGKLLGNSPIIPSSEDSNMESSDRANPGTLTMQQLESDRYEHGHLFSNQYIAGGSQ